MKTLVAFFSHAGETYFSGSIKSVQKGNAHVIAEKAASLTKGTLFEIKTKKIYPQNYQACCNEAMKELKSKERPELVNFLPNIDEFDKIILVFPCWWGTMPMAVVTFLEHYDFSGKTIFPICTHEGSQMGKSEIDLKQICPSSTICEGLPIQGSQAANCDKQLKQYLKEKKAF